MKLTYFLFLVTFFQIQANSFGQNVKVSLDLENATVESAFEQIEKITEYRFLYNIKAVNLERKVSLSFNNESLKKVLNHIFKSTNVEYSVLENQIVLKTVDKKIKSSVQRTVSGVVTDENNMPLPGVTVLIAGTQKGAVTDFDGRFSVRAAEGDVLVFNFLGYVDYEVDVTGADEYDVKMIPSSLELDQVVISTGYQTISREQATGSYGVVGNKVLETKIDQNIISKIANEIPGVLFDDNEGILVRGSASIYGTTEPLIVIDGIAVPEGFALTDINPNDVKTLTVLKDAAAASIWGIRAANGVIVIVTKKGSRNSKTTVDASVNLGYTPKLDIYNSNIAGTASQINYQKDLYAAQKLSYSTRELDSDGKNINEFFQLDPVIETLLRQENGDLNQSQVNAQLNAISLRDARKEYEDRVLRPILWNQYNLAISGGSEKQDFRASLTFNDNKSGFVNADSQQFIFNLRNSIDISEKLKARFITNFSQSKRDLGPSSPNDGLSILPGSATSASGFLSNIPITSQLLDANGNYNALVGGASRAYSNYLLSRGVPYDYTYNILQEYDNADNRVDDASLRLQAALDYEILDGLDLTLTYQYILDSSQSKNVFNENTFGTRSRVNLFTEIDPTTISIIDSHLDNGSIMENSFLRSTSHTFRGQLNYNKSFNDGLHKINAIGGYEVGINLVKTDSRRLYGYNDTSLIFDSQIDYSSQFNNFYADAPLLTNTIQIPYGNNVEEYQNRLFSYYFNAAYTYNDKYTFSASTRLDDTNLYGASADFRNIPLYSFGAKWDAYEEFFANSNTLNTLSLRASYGVNGNLSEENAGGFLLSSPRVNSGTYTNTYAQIVNIPNDQLKLEKVFTTNIGIDFGLFDFMYGSIEAYSAVSKELFSVISLNPTLGVSEQLLNVGELTNRGIDLELSFDFNQPDRDFGYFTTLNFSVNKNELTKVEFSPTDIPTRISGGIAIKGKPLSTIFSYKYAGLDTNGDPQYFDENNNVVDFKTDVSRVEALKEEGTLIPEYYGSWINEFAFKDFSLRILTSFKAGHVFRYNNRFIPGQRGDIANVTKDYVNAWKNTGDETSTSIPHIPSADDIGQFGYQNYRNIDTYVDDASHIRLNQINLGYALPKAAIEKIGMDSFRIGFQVDNVAVWSFNKWDADPESQFFPRRRTFSLNVNTSF